MKNRIMYAVLLLLPIVSYCQGDSISLENRVVSEVDTSHFDNMVLIQTFEVNSDINSVWNAYTTKEGWESWAVAIADVDFRIGGLIQTNYDQNGTIGGAGTIRLHIVNFVPFKMLTLQAELTENFPEFMKADAEGMYNTILFEEIGHSKTKITSYGIGYKNTEKYKSLLGFFIKGNELSYHNLITYLESGKPSLKY